MTDKDDTYEVVVPDYDENGVLIDEDNGEVIVRIQDGDIPPDTMAYLQELMKKAQQ